MMGHLIKILSVAAVSAVLVVSGCRTEIQSSAMILDMPPDFNNIQDFSDYTLASMTATGGLNAWLTTKHFTADSVITFYQPDGSSYLTEQHYDIYPWSNSIRISADEPQGPFSQLLRQGNFDSADSDTTSLPVNVCPRYLGQAILNLTTASARFLERSGSLVEHSQPVKIEGRWHRQIELKAPGNFFSKKPYISRIIFYQDKDSSLVDMLFFETKDGNFFAVRGYDYHEIEREGIRIPDKIEIFKADNRAGIKRRLVKIDFK